MIATVTPNPCIDNNVQVDELRRNETARAKGNLVFPGGGGVNVARAVTRLGDVPCTAYGFAGGPTGTWLRALLDAEGVAHDFIDTGLPTRINTLVTLTPDRSLVRIHTAGPEVTEEHGSQLTKQLLGLDPMPKVMVLGGSLPGRKLPPPLPRDYYGRLIDEFKTKKKDVKFILDCRDQIALGPGVDKGPFIVKPNVAELGRLFGRKTLETEKDLLQAAEHFIAKSGVTYFVISRGARGCLVVGTNERYRVSAPEAVGLTRLAAGDAFVGGLAWAIARGEPIDVAAQYAVTVGTATVTSPASALFRREEVDKLFPQARVEKL